MFSGLKEAVDYREQTGGRVFNLDEIIRNGSSRDGAVGQLCACLACMRPWFPAITQVNLSIVTVSSSEAEAKGLGI